MDDVAGDDGGAGVDFSDQQEVENWIWTQSAEIRSIIAARGALRVQCHAAVLNQSAFEEIALAQFRTSLMVASYHAVSRTERAYFEARTHPIFNFLAMSKPVFSEAITDKKISKFLPRIRAVSSRRASLHALATIASDTIRLGADKFHFFDPEGPFNDESSSNAATDAAIADATRLKNGQTLGHLWYDAQLPQEISELHLEFQNRLISEGEVWSFWHDWYLAMWEGRFTDWDLAIEVAMIPDAVWERGAKAVAVEIEGIRAKQLSAALPQAEIVEFDPDTLRFSARPITVEKPNLIGATLQQVEDSLEDVLASPSNGLSSTSREVRVIERTIRKYGNNPQQIEMGFVSAHAGLTRQIIVSELPASEENLALQTALEEGAVAIRATHPDVAENRAILMKRKFEELSPEQKEVLSEALPVLRAISDEALGDDWEHDIPALINTSVGPLPTGAPALPRADEATRIFSRAAKISILLRTSDVIHAIDGGAPYKAARIVLTISGLVTFGLAFFTLI